MRIIPLPASTPAWAQSAAGVHTSDTATMLELVRGATFCASRAAASDAVRKAARAVARALHACALGQLDARVLLATTACCAMLAPEEEDEGEGEGVAGR